MDTTSNHTADVATGAGEGRAQEFIRATIHLAGPVQIETGHAAHYTAQHVQARIGSALLYFLDYTAARDFTAAVTAATGRAAGLFSAEDGGLPASLRHPEQDTSMIVRLRGRQQIAAPQAVAGRTAPDGHAYVTCQLGGLVLVLHCAESAQRLTRVADTAHRVAAALWPQDARRAHDLGPDGGRDVHAEQWEQAQQSR